MLTIDFSKVDFYEVIKNNYNDERMEKVLSSLPAEERRVIEYRSGIEGKRLTRQAIADLMGTTLDRVRGFEGRALRRLKHPARIQMINAILDPNFEINDRVREFYNNPPRKK